MNKSILHLTRTAALSVLLVCGVSAPAIADNCPSDRSPSGDCKNCKSNQVCCGKKNHDGFGRAIMKDIGCYDKKTD